MKERPFVRGLAGSLRGQLAQREYVDQLRAYRNFYELIELIYRAGSDQRISNSEAMLLAGLFGAHEENCRIEYSAPPYTQEKSKKILQSSAGLIISSPVYFGDRSSLISEFFQNLPIKQQAGLPLDGKALGVLSVGAKRNGGQETTNIFTMFDILNKGGCITGNGPPTSQYGGTGFAGKLGTIIDDNFGLLTSYGTGKRVGILANYLNTDHAAKNTKVLFLVSSTDKKKKFIDEINALSLPLGVEKEVLDISELCIKPCLACPVCPNGKLDEDYTCAIRRNDDDMPIVHKSLKRADAIVLARYSQGGEQDKKYQVFMERTRFIRRNNFELSDRLFTSLVYTDSLSDIFPIKVVANFIRHNMFIVGPSYRRFINASGNKIDENISLDSFCGRLAAYAKKIAGSRKHLSAEKVYNYEPIGYKK